MGAALPGELLTAAEDGFRHASEYAAMGLDGAVTLSNSISIADSARLGAAMESSSRKAPGGRSALHGQVLVAKVFLGKCQQEAALPATVRSKPHPPLSKADFPDCNSVFRVKQTDQKQRLWCAALLHPLLHHRHIGTWRVLRARVCQLHGACAGCQGQHGVASCRSGIAYLIAISIKTFAILISIAEWIALLKAWREWITCDLFGRVVHRF